MLKDSEYWKSSRWPVVVCRADEGGDIRNISIGRCTRSAPSRSKPMQKHNTNVQMWF